MLQYLEKFKKLPPELQKTVSSPTATQLVSELEEKYGVDDLAVIAIKIMVKEIKWPEVVDYLVKEKKLEARRARKLEKELEEKLFGEVRNYLGAEKALAKAEEEAAGEEKLKEPKIVAKENVPAAAVVMDVDGMVEKIFAELSAAAGIATDDEILLRRLGTAARIFLRGVRGKVDTLETLMKEKETGGLQLPENNARQVIKILEKNKFDPAVKIKKPSSPFASWEQIRDVEYEFPAAAPQPVEKISEFTELAPPPPALKEQLPVVEPGKKEAASQLKAASKKQPAPAMEKAAAMPIRRPVIVDNDSDKKRMDDIIKPPSRLQGPVEELGNLNLVNFQRLAGDPVEAARKIKEKIELLGEESFTKRYQGINAWRNSPIYRMYLSLGQKSIEEGRPVAEIIKTAAAGEKILTLGQFNAIMDLNKLLRS